MDDTNPIDFEAEIPAALEAMMTVENILAAAGLEPGLRHLVKLRASQINRCTFCVAMHAREAREDGETDSRLHAVAAWEHAPAFTERERAALAWTEALTELDRRAPIAPLRARLRVHFSDSEIAALTGIVAMINLWNRIGVSRH